MNSGIYALIENRLGHEFYGLPRYVGQSKNLSKRRLSHFKLFKLNTHYNLYLQRIQDNHVKQNNSLVWAVIIHCDHDSLNYYESSLIKLYKNSVVNISEGGTNQDVVAAGRAGGLRSGKESIKKLFNSTTPEQRLEYNIKGGKTSMANMSRESKVKSGKISGSLTHKLGIGIHKQTTEERRERGLKHKNLKIGIHGLTEEQKVINSMKGVEAKQKISQERLEQQLLSAGFNKHYRPTLSEAKQHTISYCWGRVCDKHPELEGKRKTSNNGCTGCETDRKRRIRTTNKDLGPKTAPNLKCNNLTLDQL